MAISPFTGLIASVGNDGLVVVSLNGRVNPVDNKHELSSNASKVGTATAVVVVFITLSD